MQDETAVAVGDTFRIAGSSGRVEDRCSRILVDMRPFETVCVAAIEEFGVGGVLTSYVTDHENAFDGLKLATDPFEYRNEHFVGDDDSVLGVVDAVDELFVGESDVDRVETTRRQRWWSSVRSSRWLIQAWSPWILVTATRCATESVRTRCLLVAASIAGSEVEVNAAVAFTKFVNLAEQEPMTGDWVENHALLVSSLVGVAWYVGVVQDLLPPFGQLELIAAIEGRVRNP